MTVNNMKTKLCWNCEGRVAITEENCTYCGVYLSPIPIGNEDREDDIPPPPYRMEASRSGEVPPAPYQTESRDAVTALPAEGQGMKPVLMPLLLLLSGSVFFLFGLVLFLFSSKNGVFTLQWNGDLWPFYFVLGVAMLFFGWRTLSRLDDR